MDNVISAQEIKRRGISTVDEALRRGPVHVIRRNRPSYVILSEADYRRLVGRREAVEHLWDRVLADEPAGRRSADDVQRQLRAERDGWDRG